MKKLFTIFTAVIALIMVGCQEPTFEDVATSEYANIAVIADYATDDDESRVSLNGNTTKWEVGDRITLRLVVSYFYSAYANLEIVSKSDLSADGKRAIFRGTIPAGEYYGVTALYPAIEETSETVTLDRNDSNNIFMSSYKGSNDNPVLTAKAGEDAELPISFSHLMHKMDFNLTLANGYSSNDLKSDNIVVEISATSQSGDIKFAETRNFNLRSNTISDNTSATTIRAYGNKPQFSTMLFPMTTEKSVIFTFGVYIDGEKRYEIRKPDSGTLNTFTMHAGKTTTVNLELSKANSADGGEITAEAITLKATKNSIKANGVDSTTLSVVTSDGGEDVTAQSTIYANGSKLNSTTFITTSAGTYNIYAERYGVKSNTITITAEEVTTTGKTIVFAEGVSLSSGWYDVNKKAEGNNGDVNMCWAAAASNMIQWWQDRYVAAGKSLPSTAVTGAGTKRYGSYGPYELALMEIFHSDWDNSKGGSPEQAIPWYFEGKLYGGEYASAGTQAAPKSNGGYFSSVWSGIEPYVYRGYVHELFPSQYPQMYTYCYNNYSIWGNGSSLTGNDRLKKFTDLVVESFNRGMAAMTISLSSNLSSLHHAVTLWGYEIDKATGLLTRVWVTDSDDLTKEPKQQLLNEYNVSIGSGNSNIQLTGNTRYGSAWVVSLHPLSGYGSAGK